MSLTFSQLLKHQASGLHKLDKETLSRLEAALRIAESELSDSLNRLNEGTISYRQRQESLIAVRAALNKMDGYFARIGKWASKKYNAEAINQGNKELKSLNVFPISNRAVVSLDKNKFLFNSYEASMKAYSARTRSQVAQEITQGVLQRKSVFDIKSSISKKFQLKRQASKLIVRTEMHRIYNQSKLLTYQQFEKESGKKVLKALFHPMDNRTGEDSLQLAKKDPKIPLNKPFKFTYKYRLKSGAVRKMEQVAMTPPMRPNDRAVMYIVTQKQ